MDEIEAAGLTPHLAQPFAAKRMLGVGDKKTDTRGVPLLSARKRHFSKIRGQPKPTII
ncbi:MAG: hypothetical protein ACRD4Q_06390 [Candidatus Acidiferrales bacterium]